MPVFAEKKELFYLRDDPETIAELLNNSLEKQEIGSVLQALRSIVVAQNVMALAREIGLNRHKLYSTFGGEVDPALSRVLKVLWGLNVRIVAVPGPPKPRPVRPKLGRPKKVGSTKYRPHSTPRRGTGVDD
jgi:probable addiction module antidote protein